MVMPESPSRSAVSKIFRPAYLALTTVPYSKSPLFLILMLSLNFKRLS